MLNVTDYFAQVDQPMGSFTKIVPTNDIPFELFAFNMVSYRWTGWLTDFTWWIVTFPISDLNLICRLAYWVDGLEDKSSERMYSPPPMEGFSPPPLQVILSFSL